MKAPTLKPYLNKPFVSTKDLIIQLYTKEDNEIAGFKVTLYGKPKDFMVKKGQILTCFKAVEAYCNKRIK